MSRITRKPRPTRPPRRPDCRWAICDACGGVGTLRCDGRGWTPEEYLEPTTCWSPSDRFRCFECEGTGWMSVPRQDVLDADAKGRGPGNSTAN